MAGEYLAQVQALIAERMKENPEEMKRKLKEIEEAKKKAKEAPKSPPKSPPKPSIDPQLTQELIEEMNKLWGNMNIQKVKDLIKRGADIKATNKWEDTILHQASWFGDEELAKECLQAGIDVNTENDFGMTPLHYTDSVAIAKYLISAGADVNAKSNEGFAPLYVAVLRGNVEMQDLLKQHGATL